MQAESKSSGRLLYLIRQWHWISSALSLVGLLVFAFSGFLLNNNQLTKTIKPTITSWEKSIPIELPVLSKGDIAAKTLPISWRNWINQATGYQTQRYKTEWNDDEIYIDMPSAGSDAWVSILPQDRLITFEERDHGILAMLKDLHKGDNTGTIWSYFIDVFAIACMIFSFTGLLLLYFYRQQRKTTWAFVSTGFVIPVILILLFLHV